MPNLLQFKARWLLPLAGILALLAMLQTIRKGLSWVDEKTERDRLRAELAQAQAALAELESCILGGPKSPDEWLPYAILRQYAPANPATYLRRCQERIPATQLAGVEEIDEWTAAWVVSATAASRDAPDTACTYLTRVEQRLRGLGERAGRPPDAPEDVPERGSCKPEDWPVLQELLEPTLPGDVTRERVLLTGYGADESGRPNAQLAYQGTAYGVKVREQVRARYHQGAWQLLHEPLDAVHTYWSAEHAVAVTRGAPQALWLPERTAAAAGSADTDGQPMAWKRAAELPDRLLVQDMRVAAPSSERALTLVAVHHETRQWFALTGNPETGALAEPVPLTPELADSRPGQPGARTSPAQRSGQGQYCRSHITPAGHVVLACLEHRSTDASALHIYYTLAPGSAAVHMHAFELPSAMDAEVIDLCASGESVWLATRLSWLFVSRDSGRTFTRHAMPALGQGSSRCRADTWFWVGSITAPASEQTGPDDDAEHKYLSCTAETGCAAPFSIAGREVERVLVSTDGAALLFLSFARGGTSGALLLERAAAPDDAFWPVMVGRVAARASQRQRLGWQVGPHRFIDSDAGTH